MLRLAHFSDIHVTAPRLEWRARDWFNKRFAAWFNFRCLGRRYRFRHAEQVLEALRRDLDLRRPDHVIFSGDATALGFESELLRAVELLGVGSRPGLAVPGNHDYCTRPAAASGLFEKHFAPWQEGQRVDGAHYPFAQKVGPLWLVAVNSCTGNFWPWDAAGSVGPEQCRRLTRLLESLEPGPRLVVTHYPVCLHDGRPEPFTHGLRDLPDVVQTISGHIDLWLHGHRHHFYHLPRPPQAPFPVICAGSATQTGLWSYCEYSVDGAQFRAQRRVYNLEKSAFQDGDQFEVEPRA